MKRRVYVFFNFMKIATTQRSVHEHMYDQSRLDAYFVFKTHKDSLMRTMPRLCLSESDPRAKAAGVYVLSNYCSAFGKNKPLHREQPMH
jgi:hypothetical protein